MLWIFFTEFNLRLVLKVESGRSFHAFFLTLTLGGLDSDFFVVLLESGEILTGLGEFSLFHALTDVPVDEGSHGLGEITTWDNSWWLVVDSALETGWAPVDELD